MYVDRGHCYRSIFITANMCAPVSLAGVRKTFDISPGQYFPCTPQKGETEDPMSISKKCAVSGQGAMTSAQQNRFALGRVCTAHIQLIPMGKADIPSVR